MNEKIYYCTETGNSFSELELLKFYNIDSGGYSGFAEYVNACLYENNGTLIKPKMISSVRENGKVIFAVWNIKTDLF